MYYHDVVESSGVEVQPVLLPFPNMLRAGEDALLALLCELYERTGKSWLFELEVVPLILDFKWSVCRHGMGGRSHPALTVRDPHTPQTSQEELRAQDLQGAAGHLLHVCGELLPTGRVHQLHHRQRRPRRALRLGAQRRVARARLPERPPHRAAGGLAVPHAGRRALHPRRLECHRYCHALLGLLVLGRQLRAPQRASLLLHSLR